MALLTKKEFAEKCGLETKSLSVYARPDRRKVVYSGDYVDDSIEPNKSFLQKWEDRKNARTSSDTSSIQKDDLDLDYLLEEFIEQDGLGINKAAESEVMNVILKHSPLLPVLPVSDVTNICAGRIAEMAEFFLKREVSQLEIDGSSSKFNTVKEFYAQKLKQSLNECRSDMIELFEDILNDYKS